MDIFLAYEDMKPTRFIENYESLVWTERYSSFGDFTLTIKETNNLLGALRAYKFLLSSESEAIMMIETAEMSHQEDGENLIKITGRSFEAFLEHRSNELDYSDEFRDTGSIGGIVSKLIGRHLINPVNARDKIPGLVVDGGYPENPYIRVQHPRSDLYELTKKLVDSADLGFKFYRKPEGNLGFTVYKGLDRTNPASVAFRKFSPDLGNLVDSSFLSSIASYKNHARVLGARTSVEVFSPGVSIYIEGFDKRTLVVNADDVGRDYEGPITEDQEALRQRGLEALLESQHANVRLVDGDVLPQSWDPGVDLGSLVVVEDLYGNTNKMRITERIWSMDADGIRRTPTFTAID